MGLEPRAVLPPAIGLAVAAMIGCFATAGWFDHRKHDLSGVPGGHFAVSEGGRTFYVPRGGPPIDRRPQVPLTAEQYRQWQENHEAGSRWAGRGALCFLAVFGMALWLKCLGPPPAADGGAPAGGPGAQSGGVSPGSGV